MKEKTINFFEKNHSRLGNYDIRQFCLCDIKDNYKKIPFYLLCLAKCSNNSGWFFEHSNYGCCTLEFPLEGILTVEHNNKTINVYPGEFYFLPAGEYNKLSNIHKQTLNKIAFTFSGYSAINYIYGLAGNNYLFKLNNLNIVKDYYQKFHNLLEEKNPDNIPQLVGLAMEFMLKIFNFNEHLSICQEIKIGCQMMNDNIGKPFNIQTLAKELKLSPYLLNKLFSKHFNMSAKEYFNHIRMEKAKSMLSDKNVNIKEVADKIGYANQFIFSNAFKKVFSLSPTEYQKKFS